MRKSPPNKVTAHDLHPDKRLRLKVNDGECFRYDINNLFGDIHEKIANKVLTNLTVQNIGENL
ncbi:hypothetical protein AN964_12355 [Heyndrickxia shackletonii]|uniref:Uncharacterized protein n=1 Tax=Heyndrickxia shackletonii TaxID=157838 RepID=A0A0Q3WY60_9BACI|nr:hypothetical protein AN964_12355 [Heyndrickxia shackletonii]